MEEVDKTEEFSFNESFCGDLEYKIGEAFENSGNEVVRGFWCDGVSWNPSPSWKLSKKYINDNRMIVTKAWLGKEGQDEYEMTIHLGKYSLRRYAKGSALRDCIPSTDSMDWININVDKKQIAIFLE